MNSFSKNRHGKLAWAFEELQILQNTENNQPFDDHTVVHLEASDAIEMLESNLLELASTLEPCLASRGYRFAHNKSPIPERDYAICACRKLSIIPEHPARPYTVGHYPSGFSRLEIKLGSAFSSLNNYSSISFPQTVNIELVLHLLRNASATGIPPTLTCSEDIDGRPYYDVVFKSGCGLRRNLEETPKVLWMKLLQHMAFLDIAEETVKCPTGKPGVYGLIEAVNCLAKYN
jgi:hypothetical protein